MIFTTPSSTKRLNMPRGTCIWHKIFLFFAMMLPRFAFRQAQADAKLAGFGFYGHRQGHRYRYRNDGCRVLRNTLTGRFLSVPVPQEKLTNLMPTPGYKQDEFKEQMKDWRGTSRSTSQFVSHFIASGNNVTIEDAIWSVMPQRRSDLDLVQRENRDDDDDEEEIISERRMCLMDAADDKVISSVDMKFRHDPSYFPLDENELYPVDLLAMGAIWFLPADAPRDPALGLKPIRLGVSNLTNPMIEGDYLRIHHSPRRFPVVSDFDWGKDIASPMTHSNKPPGVMVKEDPERGYIIVNKPAGVPVHPTVDNNIENVAGAVGRSLLSRRREEIEMKIEAMSTVTAPTNRTIAYSKHAKANKGDPPLYVVTPQRLDQNTSGLFVVATKKEFASYYAKLLRKKTDALLQDSNEKNGASAKSGRIQKKYRCLVCVMPKENEGNGNKEVDRLLRPLAQERSLVTHYLKKEKGAPRTFSSEYYDDWLECLMRITDVGDVIPLGESRASEKLCKELWGDDDKPASCSAIVQVEVELLTGRTHQIRGQMSTLGFPLCGDKMYGGAVSSKKEKEPLSNRDGYSDGYINSQKLALQCCELSFLDPDYKQNSKNGKVTAVSSDRLNSFRLDKAWWTDLVADSFQQENKLSSSSH